MAGKLRRAGAGIAAAGALLLAVGCATVADGGDAPDFATIVIDNDSPLTVTVFTVRQSTRFRLGTVPGLTRRDFPVERHMLDNASFLQLVIDPLGGQQSYHTDRIVVDQGDEVRLRVSNFIR